MASRLTGREVPSTAGLAKRLLGKDIAKRILKEDQEKVSRAKFPKELTIEVLGQVTSVIGFSKTKSFEISLETNQVPKKISFEGYTPIVAGDTIAAGIFVGEREYLDFFYSGIEDPRINTDNKRELSQRYVLVPRDFNEEEEALYLKVIRDGNEVRTDFSVDWNSKFYS